MPSRIASAAGSGGTTMEMPSPQDAVFLAARLHARRSRVAESLRLDELCALRSVADLWRRIHPGSEPGPLHELQRGLHLRLAEELRELQRAAHGPVADWIALAALRLQIADAKVIVRGILQGLPPEEIRRHLLPLPGVAPARLAELASARSIEQIARLLDDGPIGPALARAANSPLARLGSYAFEASLDRYWLNEMIARSERLCRKDAKRVARIAAQEADIFHLALVLRGRFHQGIAAAELRPWFIEGTPLGPKRLDAMLASADARAAVAVAATTLFGPAVAAEALRTPAGLTESSAEAMAWGRFLGLAREAFRRSEMSDGVIAGYVAIRRVEVANLITLSEGIRAGVPPASLRARLVPRTGEAAHA